MTWRNWAWRGPMFIVLMVLTLPMLAFLVPMYVMEQDSESERNFGVFVLLSSVVLIIVLHNWINIRPGKVQLGFFPLYRRTLDISEIRYAMSVEFEPMRDFGGYGIKGLAKARNGLLLGGNPKHGLMLETIDRRRYVLSFADPEPVLQALEQQGCTLAAGIDDILSGEV